VWRSTYAGLQDVAYKLYSVPAGEREFMAGVLPSDQSGEPWPERSELAPTTKRLEHVLRLLSYIVKLVCEDDEDGVVPLVSCGDEATLLDRARRKFDEFFGEDQGDAIEAEINAELKVRIKGSKHCGPKMDMETWLAARYFEFHVKLYKSRPIYWHITSEAGSFGAICHYHKLNRNRLQKLRAHYLASFIDRLRRDAGDLRGNDSREAWNPGPELLLGEQRRGGLLGGLLGPQQPGPAPVGRDQTRAVRGGA